MEKVRDEVVAGTESSLAAPVRRRRRWKWILPLVALVPVAIFALYVLATLNFSYSTGDRVGYLQKFSHKGWLCKTWEGEIAMATIPGAMPEIFHFTVRDDSVAKQLRSLGGQRIAVHYEQHKGVPTNCFGDTEYFVNGAEAVQGP